MFYIFIGSRTVNVTNDEDFDKSDDEKGPRGNIVVHQLEYVHSALTETRKEISNND